MAYPYNNYNYNAYAYGGNYQQANNGNYGNIMNQNQGFQQGQQNQQNGNVAQNYTPQNYGMYNYNPMFYNPYQHQQQMQQPQTIYHPLTYVSGVEGAKAFVVDANKKVFLLDSETNEKLFIKYADNEGRYKMETYRLVKDDGNIKQDTQTQNLSNNDLTKDYLTTYVANQINALEEKFKGNFNELMRKIESLSKQNTNIQNNNSQNTNNQRKNIKEGE